MYLATLLFALVAHAVPAPTVAPVAPTVPFVARRAIYCSGTRAALTYSRVEALCIDVRHARVYHLSVVGIGGSVQLEGTVFRLAVDYDVSRYDPAFDPFPGEYFAQSTGIAFGPGYTAMIASAGNKILRGYAYNVGLGFDYTLAALLVIR